jgi:tetratricopeptide (TPR) repeat protein
MPVFCGRERELAQLLATWETVKSGTSGPRVTVLLAESGLGKTRLAQEFFARLSRSENASGSTGYWPDDLGRDGNNLRINPPEASCDAEAELPFLWWGLRLVDPLAHNRIAAGVLAPHVERDLVPHLEPMYRAQRRRQRLTQLAKIGGGLAADAITDLVPFLGLAKTVGEVGLELKALHSSWRRDREALDPNSLAADRRASLVDRVIGDLTALFSGKAGARVPGVILIDDGQFSTHDPGLVAFVEALLEAMTSGDWPLLLLVTHWEREWAQQTGDAAPSVARALTVFGYDEQDRVDCLRMAPVDDLEPMLREALPGLPPEQAQALLARADGNPRFLDEILRIATSVRGRALFVGRNPSEAMTEAGLADLLARSVALHDLIAERLAASPAPVQKAVALASVQGSEFLRRLVGETAAALGEPATAIGEAITEAQRAHAYVAEVSEGVAAFAQRIYHEVARELLPAWFDLGDVEAALADVVRRIATSPDGVELSADDLAHLCVLAAALFEDSGDEQDRRIAAATLSRLIDGAEARGDVHGALALTRRLAQVIESLSDGLLDGDLYWLRQTNRMFAAVSDREARRPILLRQLTLTRATHEEEPTLWSSWMLAVTLVQVGDFFGEEGNAENATVAYIDALEVMTGLAPDDLDVDALEAYSIVCDRVGGMLVGRGDLAAAIEIRTHALRLAERVNEIDPGPARLVNLAVAERRLGQVAIARGGLPVAEPHFNRAVGFAREAVEQGLGWSAEANLAESLAGLADLATMRDAFDAGSALLQEALTIRRRHRKAADTIDHRRAVAVSLLKMATCAKLAGDFEAAWTHVAEALDLLRAAAAATAEPEIRARYAASLIAASEIAVSRRRFDEAGLLAEEALPLARDLARASKGIQSQHALLQAMSAALPFIAARDISATLPVLAEADAAFASIPEAARWISLATMGEIEDLRAKVLEREGDAVGAAAARQRRDALYAAVPELEHRGQPNGGSA